MFNGSLVRANGKCTDSGIRHARLLFLLRRERPCCRPESAVCTRTKYAWGKYEERGQALKSLENRQDDHSGSLL